MYQFSEVSTIKIPMVFLASQTGLNMNVKLHPISLCFKGYSETCQGSKMLLFTKLVNNLRPLTIFTNSSIFICLTGF